MDDSVSLSQVRSDAAGDGVLPICHLYIYHDLESQPLHDVEDGAKVYHDVTKAIIFQVFGESIDSAFTQDVSYWVCHPSTPDDADDPAAPRTPEAIIEQLRTAGAIVLSPGGSPDAVAQALIQRFHGDLQKIAKTTKGYRDNTAICFITCNAGFADYARQCLRGGLKVVIIYDGEKPINTAFTSISSLKKHHVLSNWLCIQRGRWFLGLPPRPTEPRQPPEFTIYREEQRERKSLHAARELEVIPEDHDQPFQNAELLESTAPSSRSSIQRRCPAARASSSSIDSGMGESFRGRDPSQTHGDVEPSPLVDEVSDDSRTISTRFTRALHNRFVPLVHHGAVKANMGFKKFCSKHGLRYFAFTQRRDHFKVLITSTDPYASPPPAPEILGKVLASAYGLHCYAIESVSSARHAFCFVVTVDKRMRGYDAKGAVEAVLSMESAENKHLGPIMFSAVPHSGNASEFLRIPRSERGDGTVVNFFTKNQRQHLPLHLVAVVRSQEMADVLMSSLTSA